MNDAQIDSELTDVIYGIFGGGYTYGCLGREGVISKGDLETWKQKIKEIFGEQK